MTTPEQEAVDLADYSEWRWVPTPPSPGMIEAALAHQGNVAEMLKAAWDAAPKPWLRD